MHWLQKQNKHRPESGSRRPSTANKVRKKAKSSLVKPSLLKQIVVISGLFMSLFGGMFAAIVGVHNFQNYNSPYLFAFTFGAIGLIAGLRVARKIKPHVIWNAKMRVNYSTLTIMFSAGFVGSAMLMGHYFNSAISTLHMCGNFVVIDKEYNKGGFRRPELNILVVKLGGETHRLLCSQNYWQRTSVGQTANACIYESPIGFDYITLPDNN